MNCSSRLQAFQKKKKAEEAHVVGDRIAQHTSPICSLSKKGETRDKMTKIIIIVDNFYLQIEENYLF